MSILPAHVQPPKAAALLIRFAELDCVAHYDNGTLTISPTAEPEDVSVALLDVVRMLAGEQRLYARKPRHLKVVR